MRRRLLGAENLTEAATLAAAPAICQATNLTAVYVARAFDRDALSQRGRGYIVDELRAVQDVVTAWRDKHYLPRDSGFETQQRRGAEKCRLNTNLTGPFSLIVATEGLAVVVSQHYVPDRGVRIDKERSMDFDALIPGDAVFVPRDTLIAVHADNQRQAVELRW